MKSIYLNKLFRKLAPFFDKRKNIIIFSTDEYHSIHLYPVIKELSKIKEFRIFLVGSFKVLPYCIHYPTLDHLSFFLKYDLYISTEQHIPWKIEVKKVFFGHGVGPKLDYQTSLYLNKFDYLLTSCQVTHEVQSVLEPDLVKVGLPLLDKFEGISKKELMESFGFKNVNNPIVVYAPSWNTTIERISDIPFIIKMLSSLKSFNVIISPHPNLLKPDMCQGLDFFRDSQLEINQKFNTLDLCASADLVISDISSILFEAMALNRIVLFDGNELVYLSSGAEKVLTELKKSIPTVDWANNLELQFEGYLKKYKYSPEREAFIRSYLFNIGSATEVFKNSIQEMVKGN